MSLLKNKNPVVRAIIITKEIRNGFNLHCGVSNIDWVNGNFIPINPEGY